MLDAKRKFGKRSKQSSAVEMKLTCKVSSNLPCWPSSYALIIKPAFKIAVLTGLRPPLLPVFKVVMNWRMES